MNILRPAHMYMPRLTYRRMWLAQKLGVSNCARPSKLPLNDAHVCPFLRLSVLHRRRFSPW